MFNLSNEYMTNMWIDTIQNAKKSWVNTWVKDETMSKPMLEFIDTQTTFTKEAVQQVSTLANATGDLFAKAVK